MQEGATKSDQRRGYYLAGHAAHEDVQRSGHEYRSEMGQKVGGLVMSTGQRNVSGTGNTSWATGTELNEL